MQWTRLDAALAAFARRGRLLAFGFAILASLPTLRSPLFADDVLHRVALLDRLPGLHRGALDLYDFIGGPGRSATLLRDYGFVPWFTADDLKVRFFRPLSSALLAADVYVFSDRVWIARLHSLAWFLAVVWLASWLHRRFLPPRTAGLATFTYAVSVGHLMPVLWIAARHALITAACSLASFALHVRGRDLGIRSARVVALFPFVAGLLAGEAALGALALIGSWELLARRDSARARLLAVAPFVGVALLYLAAYVALGYGVHSSGAYIGPDRGVLGALAALRHFLILMGELIAATPSDAFGGTTTAIQIAAAAWGALTAAIAWGVIRLSRPYLDVRERIAVPWMAAAAAAAALPGSLAIVGGRVLTLALVPASGVVAMILVGNASALRAGGLPRARRRAVAVIVVALAVSHLVVAPVLRLATGGMLAHIAIRQRDLAAEAPSCVGTFVIVAAADPTIATYVPATMVLGGRSPGTLRVLSTAQSDHRIENVTRTGFDLVILDRNRTRTMWERLYRSAPLNAGTRVSLPSLNVTVLDDEDGAPTRVHFDFGEPLDSGRLCFVQWRDARIERLAPPGPGQVVTLPHQPGPMGF